MVTSLIRSLKDGFCIYFRAKATWEERHIVNVSETKIHEKVAVDKHNHLINIRTFKKVGELTDKHSTWCQVIIDMKKMIQSSDNCVALLSIQIGKC